MKRKGRIGLGAALLLIAGALVALNALTADSAYRDMTGVDAVVDTRSFPDHGFLGIEFEQVVAAPLVIDNVLPGTGAARAGLRTGDEVVGISGARDPNGVDVQKIVEDSRPGDMLHLTIRRGGEESEVEVQLISARDLQSLHLGEQQRRAATQSSSNAATAPATTGPSTSPR
jgi:S1-C subfamily serine protease